MVQRSPTLWCVCVSSSFAIIRKIDPLHVQRVTKRRRTKKERESYTPFKISYNNIHIYYSRDGHHQRTMRLDICALSIPNNTNATFQHWRPPPKYRPASTVCSQHSDYHHRGPLQDVLQQTASHSSAWQKVMFKVEEAIIALKSSINIATLFP
jgi:hypothetical protein